MSHVGGTVVGWGGDNIKNGLVPCRVEPIAAPLLN